MPSDGGHAPRVRWFLFYGSGGFFLEVIMAKEKDPAFLMYSKDWLSGTAEYMPDEKGVYIDLLCHQHLHKGLPIETEKLARMVGLSHRKFLKIWSEISHHFEKENDRFINRKLNKLIEERAEKGRINTITGTFAGMLRLGNYSTKEYKYLKANFKPADFIEFYCDETTDRLTDRLTKWIENGLKSIGIGNENGNGNEDIYSKEVKELYKGVEIFFDENLRPKDQNRKNKWYDTLDKLIRIDGKTPEQIIQVVKKVRMDDFWHDKFLSITKLRDNDKNGVQYFLRFEKLYTGENKFIKPEYHATDF